MIFTYLSNNLLANSYFGNLEFSESVYHSKRALTWAENNLKIETFNIKLLIGHAFLKMGKYDEALLSYKSCLEIKDPLLVGVQHIKIHQSIGSLYTIQDSLELALSHFNQALEIAHLNKINETELIEIYENLGKIYLVQEEYGKSIENINIALDLNEIIEDEKAMAYNLTHLAESFFANGDNDHALSLAIEALDRGSEMGYMEIIKENIKTKMLIAAADEEPMLALDYYKQYIQFSDSVHDTKIIRIKEDISSQHNPLDNNTEQIEAKVNSDESNLLIYLMGGLNILLFILLFRRFNFFVTKSN